MKTPIPEKNHGTVPKKRLCFIATLEMSINAFLKDHLVILQEYFDLTVITNTQDPGFLRPYGINAKVISVQIERNVSPPRDLVALCHLWKIFRREHFDIVHSIMPKSGLLSMVAGFFAEIPVRIHTFTGQIWKNKTGLTRLFFKNIDKVLVFFSTHILVDSPSQRQFLIGEGIVGEGESFVIGNGSMCGVDRERFKFDIKAREDIRHNLGIRSDDIVYLFLGRLNRDKGLLELSQAFANLAKKIQAAHLVLVGRDEQGMAQKIRETCTDCHEKLHILGYTNNPQDYMSAADVLCLPSYREGFGLVIIEAGAVGIPSIGTRIYGITDTIEDGTTGYMVEPGSYFDLMEKMLNFAMDRSLIKTMGVKARQRALAMYSRDDITSAMINFYFNLRNSH